MRSASSTWFHSNGNVLKSAGGYFWNTNQNMRVGTGNYFPNGATLKNGSSIAFDNGNTFFTGTTAFYANAASLLNAGNLLYEGGAQLLTSGTFRYSAGATMIDSSGAPFQSNGAAAATPFNQSANFTNSNEYVSLDVDEIARYAVTVRRPISNYVLGGNVDYSVATPPVPTSLTIDQREQDAVTLSFASGGGSTQDYVYAYNLGTTAPYTADGGTVVTGTSFTIDGLAPGQPVAVRLFARNSEGELSPGAVAVAYSLLEADFNADDSVDAFDLAQWEEDYGLNADSDADNNGDSDGLDFLAWQRNYGAMLPPPLSEPTAAVFAGSEDGASGSPDVSAATGSPAASAVGSHAVPPLDARLIDLALTADESKAEGGRWPFGSELRVEEKAEVFADEFVPQATRTEAVTPLGALPRPTADFGDIAASRPRDDDSVTDAALDASLDEEFFATF